MDNNIVMDESRYNMIDWFKKVVFQNYGNFEGRARRSEFWYFELLVIIGSFLLGGLQTAINIYVSYEAGTVVEWVSNILNLLLFVPSLAVGARRLHDINKSGWWQLIALTGFGIILLLVWFFTEGDRHANQYGDDPKNPTEIMLDIERETYGERS